jgi:hypothetical protein
MIAIVFQLVSVNISHLYRTIDRPNKFEINNRKEYEL